MLTSLIAGTMFLVWLGELITERGLGNGISLIIFGGIVANFPQLIGRSFWRGTRRRVCCYWPCSGSGSST